MTTTTSTTSSATASAAQALFTSLSSGSGVDTNALVTSLVQAQFAAKSAALSTKSDAITAQISSASTLMSNVSQFAAALKTLATGGTLQTQPVSSNTAALNATALSGAKLAGLSSSIGISQLASGQIARTTTPVASRTTALGTGQLTLTLGTATYDTTPAMTGFTPGSGTPVTIDIVAGSENLDGIAAAINAKAAGVTASVVTDANGAAYLSLKGASGAAQAFTLTANDDPTGNLAQLNVGQGATGTALASVAQNARLTVDGVTVERASNTIDDLVAGVKLQLTGTTTTTPVSLTSTTPTTALTGAVTDFVDTYNAMLKTLNEQLDPKTGPLKGDPAAQSLLRSLRTLTTTTLLGSAAAGTPTTLGEIGVKTNRDGTLAVDTATLTRALSVAPDAVEAMFSFSSNSTDGLTAALNSISLNASSTLFGLGASTKRYNEQASAVAKAQDDISTQSDAMTTRLTQQYASMNAKVAAYKSTQAFLKNQIDSWNKSS